MESEKLEPNSFAQNVRHKRVFLKNLFFSRFFFRLLLDIKSFRPKRVNGVFLNEPVIVQDPFKKFIRQTVTLSIALLVVTSIAPTNILETATGFTADSFITDTDFIEEPEEDELGSLLINEEGFVLKPSPLTEEVSRIGFTDSVKHTVVSGETLSTIAALYGISVKTLLWENNISEHSPLKIGQTLIVPSVDGFSYTVTSKTSTLSRIAKEIGVEDKLIREHNNLESDFIQKGQKLFIPGGKKRDPILVRAAGKSGGKRIALSVNTFDAKIIINSDAQPRDGKRLIFPTTGRVTQGFRGGHYGIDIAHEGKPDVWASASGTVVKAHGGCFQREEKSDRNCGGGYGNHVVLDHGDGLQTLYGHLETIYVTEGQAVEGGQALGKMGNSGRVYGKTGIHVHFEVIDRGVKRNGANYM